jgi:hypothetical protein
LKGTVPLNMMCLISIRVTGRVKFWVAVEILIAGMTFDRKSDLEDYYKMRDNSRKIEKKNK